MCDYANDCSNWRPLCREVTYERPNEPRCFDKISLKAQAEPVAVDLKRRVINEGKEMHPSMKVMSSSEDMTRATPREWFGDLNLEFGFTLDPCCVEETAKCKKFFTPEDDGLAQTWADERVFMNPPYGREIGKWMKKAYEEARDNGTLVVCFVPARVDTNWWHNWAARASEIRFPKGRVKNPTGVSWPFPVAIVLFRPHL